MLAAPLRHPVNHPIQRRHPRPSDWGIGMTLCIAAVARDKAIIAVSDMRFDLGYTSGDGMRKVGELNNFWHAMFAGSDVGNAPALLANIADALEGATDASRKQVEKLFRDDYRAALDQRIESLVLSPYKLTVNEFSKTGVRRFTPDVFAKLCLDMAAVEVPYEFLVFGFDEKRKPHIFRVHKGGLVEDYRSIGFWAIGSGDVAAVHHMLFHGYNSALPLRTAAYHACAAKYFAERANLGERTHVVCLMKDGRIIGIDEKAIRKLWQRSGRPRIPKNVWNRLPPFHDIEGRVRPSDDKPDLPRPSGTFVPVFKPGESIIVGDWITAAITGVEGTGAVGTLTPSVSETPPDPATPPVQKSPKRGRKARKPLLE